jgi:PAS domain S-box-containing protein
VPEILERLRALTDDLPNPGLLSQVVESLPDALLVVAADGSVVLFNRQAEMMFGYHRSEVLGRSVDALVPEALRGRHAEHREGFSTNPTPRQVGAGVMLSGRHKDGTEFPVEIGLSPIPTADGLYVSAVIRKLP